GDLVQVDCFYIGRLSGTRGRTWQYTAIDVASSYVWASVQVSEVNPDTKHCTALVRRVAGELSTAGWKLKAVSTDNGGEFRARPYRPTQRRSTTCRAGLWCSEDAPTMSRDCRDILCAVQARGSSTLPRLRGSTARRAGWG